MLGYVLNRVYWGKCYGYEAVKAVVFGFAQGIRCFKARYYPDNDRSHRLLVRLGFTDQGLLLHEAIVPNRSADVYQDIRVCSLSKEDFYAATRK